MPEGHTIHRLAARHRELFAGQRITVESPQGRFADGAGRLSGSVLRSTEAYGKHLLHHYDRGTVHIHLGLYGKFADGAGAAPAPVGQVRLRMRTRRNWLELRGPTACEIVDELQVKALVSRLGADPLRDDGDHEAAFERIRRSPTPLGALLLNQEIVAGTGLIFVTEVLYRAALLPTTPGRALTHEGWQGIWGDLRVLMALAVGTGRIDTVRDEHLPEAMGRAPRVDRHGGEVYVYRRTGQPCLVCGTPVRFAELAARNFYWCPVCQH
ncbi:endonuclease-8 [Allocatelliglobosispora scoriae]|uniref:DNA-(apurinic or apyrimidinic site) lyase n=1 Tax=Allocatelliglobosispora scoriae TaxID=643052 RepID=A0A841BPM4_9ACTN|nr:Fpg/Nei family DNA glycosylase [Allocatelliglobosispora scoriae]MBB5869635.1 endonuclease-8 [Allocatelliglobosispora scoriae]